MFPPSANFPARLSPLISLMLGQQPPGQNKKKIEEKRGSKKNDDHVKKRRFLVKSMKL